MEGMEHSINVAAEEEGELLDNADEMHVHFDPPQVVSMFALIFSFLVSSFPSQPSLAKPR